MYFYDIGFGGAVIFFIIMGAIIKYALKDEYKSFIKHRKELKENKKREQEENIERCTHYIE